VLYPAPPDWVRSKIADLCEAEAADVSYVGQLKLVTFKHMVPILLDDTHSPEPIPYPIWRPLVHLMLFNDTRAKTLPQRVCVKTFFENGRVDKTYNIVVPPLKAGECIEREFMATDITAAVVAVRSLWP
jgi:hypothetical protein